MKTTHLQHHPSLGYIAAGSLRSLPVGLLLPHECSSFISFRAHPFRKPERVIRELHAAQRPLCLYGAGSYCFMVSRVIHRWHPAAVGRCALSECWRKITVIEDTPIECYLDRDYFAGSLKVIARSANSVTYTKVSGSLQSRTTISIAGPLAFLSVQATPPFSMPS